MKIDDVKSALEKYNDACVYAGVGAMVGGIGYHAYTNGNIPACIIAWGLTVAVEAAAVRIYLEIKREGKSK